MRSTLSSTKCLLVFVTLFTTIGLAACTAACSPTTSPTPTLSITAPADGATIPAGSVTVTVQTTNFDVVNKLGQSNILGEGHIHYYIDVDAPTTPGQPAVTAPGTYAESSETSYTWTNVTAGTHTFSTQLVNNDHTPLATPVVATITVNVSSSGGQSITINLTAQNLAFDKSTITVPAGVSVTIIFDNKDNISHNFALYETSSAQKSIFIGQIITAGTIEYKFTAPATPGTYFFRCDVHPTMMNGSFVVTGN